MRSQCSRKPCDRQAGKGHQVVGWQTGCRPLLNGSCDRNAEQCFALGGVNRSHVCLMWCSGRFHVEYLTAAFSVFGSKQTSNASILNPMQ